MRSIYLAPLAIGFLTSLAIAAPVLLYTGSPYARDALDSPESTATLSAPALSRRTGAHLSPAILKMERATDVHGRSSNVLLSLYPAIGPEKGSKVWYVGGASIAGSNQAVPELVGKYARGGVTPVDVEASKSLGLFKLAGTGQPMIGSESEWLVEQPSGLVFTKVPLVLVAIHEGLDVRRRGEVNVAADLVRSKVLSTCEKLGYVPGKKIRPETLFFPENFSSVIMLPMGWVKVTGEDQKTQGCIAAATRSYNEVSVSLCKLIGCKISK